MAARRDQRSAKASAYRHLYHTPEWRSLRKRQLQAHPWCAECKRRGRTTPATVAHHIKEHKGDRALFFDPRNLESACQPCHDRVLQSKEKLGYTKGVDASGRPIDEGHPWNTPPP